MAYRLHNEDALMAASTLIANALNITESTDSSPPNAHNRLWHLKTTAAQRGIVVTTDQLIGQMCFFYTSGIGNKLTISLNFWSPEVPTTITVANESVTFSWNGNKMVTRHTSKLPEWMRKLADPEISPGRNWLRRNAGCTGQSPGAVRLQQT